MTRMMRKNIYSKNALFNIVHDFSCFYRYITVLLLEKAVVYIVEFPQVYQYAGRLKVLCFQKGELKQTAYIKSLNQIVRGILKFIMGTT